MRKIQINYPSVILSEVKKIILIENILVLFAVGVAARYNTTHYVEV